MRFFPSSFSVLFATVIFFVNALHAQVSLTATPYTQNFNTLAKTATASTLPTGWLLLETGTNANLTYTAGTGSSTSGDTYSFGLDAADDRALGTVQSGSLIPSIGVAFTNTTGGAVTSLKIAYVGEQWRLAVGVIIRLRCATLFSNFQSSDSI
jgi:hypothetical protein